MVFDVYVPSLNLIFEYQGHQHYNDNYLFGEIKSRLDRENEKHGACNSVGISYLKVPYWWQRDKESIVGVLHRYRPDILDISKDVFPFSYKEKKRITVPGNRNVAVCSY